MFGPPSPLQKATASSATMTIFRWTYRSTIGSPTSLPPAGPVQPAYVPSAETLAALPADWLVDLQQATTRADLPLILDLADQVRGYDSALAECLADMARNYEYKKILTLIEQAGGQP